MTGRRPLYGWLVADAISLTGTRISMIALPWLVLTTTGSATLTGLVAAAETVPMVAVKVLGGPLIDRLGGRRVTLACDVLSMVVVAAIPLLYAADAMRFPLLLALVALTGALRGPGDAAKDAMAPGLAVQAAVPLERVTGLSGVVERTAGMLGAALAGALVALVGPAQALLLDALSFGVAAAVLAWATRGPAVVDRTALAGPADTDRTSYLRRLREGWRFLRHDPVLLGITLMVAVTNMLDIAYASVLVPVWAERDGGGPVAIGTVFAVWAGASALGSVAAAAWADRLPRYRVYLVAFLLTGAPRFWVFALDSPLAAVLGVVVVGGFASGFLNPVIGAVVFERIPPHLVGRVSSLVTATAFALMPLGGLLGGVLVEAVDLPVTMALVGAAYLAVTLLPAADRRWRELDRRPVAVPGAAPDGRLTH